MRRDGSRPRHGGRRHYCPTSGTYRGHIARIVERLATEFARHPNVVAWQVDNELGPETGDCFCPSCSARWRSWLAQRYGSLDGLNAAWQTKFWSVTYTDWSQLDLRDGEGYPSIELDIRRFLSDCWIDFFVHQAAILRRCHPAAIITTNLMGPLFRWIDYHKLAPFLDVACADLYFDMSTAPANGLFSDVFRCLKPGKAFWITETGSAALSTGKPPHADQLRTWAFSAIARGSEAHVFFRWRTCLAGQEQDLQGIIETSGRARRRYEAVRRLFGELERLGPELAALPLPKPDVALAHSYDSHWSFMSTRISGQAKELEHVYAMAELFFDRNLALDPVPLERNPMGYRLLVLPSVCFVSREAAEGLTAFVKAGGVVLATPQLASRDGNNNYVPRCAPDGMLELFGLRVESRAYLDNACEPDQALWFPKANLVLETAHARFEDGAVCEARAYLEDVELDGARSLALFSDNLFEGSPAATVNEFGTGAAFYVAAYLDPEGMGRMVDLALARAGVARGPTTPKWVEVVRRGNMVFLINHSRVPCNVAVAGSSAMVGDWRDGIARLPAYGVCVVRE